LISIAPREWWLEKFPRYDEEGNIIGINTGAVLDFLIEGSYRVGHYPGDRAIHKVGAWDDDGRLVMHLGDRMLVGDELVPIWRFKSRDLYRIDSAIKFELLDPLSIEESDSIFATIKSLRWSDNIDPWLFAGWIVLAPFSGAFYWRPHIWIIGPTAIGKTTLLQRIMLSLSGGAITEDGLAIFSNGSSTEAGIRQLLERETRPIILDEAEADSGAAKDEARLRAILGMLRAASSQSSGVLAKGSPGQKAILTEVGSMGALYSISGIDKALADKTRISTPELRMPTKDSDGNPVITRDDEKRVLAADWKVLEPKLDEVTLETGWRLIRRTAYNWSVIKGNIKAFTSALRPVIGGRFADQVGTLLAGAHSLSSTSPISVEGVCELLRLGPPKPDVKPLFTFATEHEIGAERDHDSVADFINGSPVVLQGFAEAKDRYTVTIGEAIAMILSNRPRPSGISPIDVRRCLKAVGIWPKDGSVRLRFRAPALNDLMGRSRWRGGSWVGLLRQRPGATVEHLSGEWDRGVLSFKDWPQPDLDPQPTQNSNGTRLDDDAPDPS
jgi:hypothetical protein